VTNEPINDEVLQKLFDNIRHTRSSEAKEQAINELAQRPLGTVPMLLNALKSDSYVSRFTAAEVLGNIGDLAFIPHLIEAIKIPPPGSDAGMTGAYYHSFSRSLAKIAISQPQIAVPILVDAAFQNILHRAVRQCLIDTLAWLDHPLVIAKLFEALEHEDKGIRYAAVWLLEARLAQDIETLTVIETPTAVKHDWKMRSAHDAVREKLLRVVQEDEDADIRKLAANTLERHKRN
jgi:HEAT repeat protein